LVINAAKLPSIVAIVNLLLMISYALIK